MKIIIPHPHGFCAGVVMAIRALERSLELFGAPLYVFHEIVHNRPVVRRFEQRGVVFVETLDEVPRGANLLYSAHGVSPDIRRLARERELRVIDATCPLVLKVHLEAKRFARLGYTIVLIGHEGHDEVVGVIGEAPGKIVVVASPQEVDRLVVVDERRVAYLTQTTLGVDDAVRVIAALERRFPGIVGPPKQDICFATQNRQEALRLVVPECDVVLVVGSQNSSNACRLVEVAVECGKPAYLIDGAADLKPEWFEGVQNVALTAGASTPEDLVGECACWLIDRYHAELVERVIRTEDADFPLPKALREAERHFSPVAEGFVEALR